jgi:hypothetical protein
MDHFSKIGSHLEALAAELATLSSRGTLLLRRVAVTTFKMIARHSEQLEEWCERPRAKRKNCCGPSSDEEEDNYAGTGRALR